MVRESTLLTCVILLLAGAAAATPNRYALVIGSNLGEPDEAPLAYAERDAARVADVLVRLGRVPEENLRLLRGPNVASVRRVLTELRTRVAEARAGRSDRRTILFLYYSGHAGATALHLGGHRLDFATLRRLATDVGVDATVLVVDACRSGGLTRVKGGIPDKPFDITVEDQLHSTGVAIITSSAHGEDAQESERLAGGIFTHHLLNGLSGAADSSRDRRVTLTEAYRYAYAQTLRATTRTRVVQHPTYSFRLKGRRELVVTHLDTSGSGLGRLRFERPGRWIVFQQGEAEALVAEVDVSAGAELVLPRGRYLARRREFRAVFEGQVSVEAGRTATLSESTLRRLPYARTVRRGLSASRVWSLGAALEASGPPLADLSVGLYGALVGQVDLQAVALQLRLRGGRASGQNPHLSLTHDMWGLDVGAFKVFDIPRVDLGLGVGVRAGGDWVVQSFDTRGSAEDRAVMVWRVAPVVRVEYTPTARLALALDCGADISLARVEQADGAELTTPVVPFCALATMVYLP